MSELEILLADNHLLAVRKPAGVPMVPDPSGDPSLLDLAKDWVAREKQKPGAVFLAVVHRLDRPVSGVALFARTSKAAERLARAFRERTVRKIYWGIAAGLPLADSGEIEQWLIKDEGANVVRAVATPRPQAKLATTRFRVLERGKTSARLELEPLTGRAHQLRVAVASLCAPLLGDLKYGAKSPLPDRSIALHARALELEHPTRGVRVRVECPPPPTEWWRALR